MRSTLPTVYPPRPFAAVRIVTKKGDGRDDPRHDHILESGRPAQKPVADQPSNDATDEVCAGRAAMSSRFAGSEGA